MKQKQKDSAVHESVSRQIKRLEHDSALPYVAAGVAIVILFVMARISFLGGLASITPFIRMDDVPSSAAIGVILILLLVNVLFRIVTRRNFVSQKSLVTCYNMLTIGGIVLTTGLFWWIPFILTGYQRIIWLMRTNPDVFSPIYQQYSSWIMPQSEDAVFDFWLGLGTATVPWAEWARPIFVWSIFFGVAFFMLLCVASLITRQWNEIEHLTYPIATLMTEMTDIESKGERRTNISFWRNKYAWFGMMLSGVFVSGFNGLHHYFPAFPQVTMMISINNIMSEMGEVWIAVMRTWPLLINDGGYLVFSPIAIGIGYLMSLELTFSIWSLTLFMIIIRIVSLYVFGIGTIPGAGRMATQPYMITLGGFIGLAIYSSWIARRDIANIFRSAFQRQNSEFSESNSPLGNKVAAIGFVFSVIFFVLFGYVFLKASPVITLAVVVLYLATALGMARIRAEVGFPESVTFGQFYEYEALLKGLGMKALGYSNAGSLHFYLPLSYGRIGGLLASVVDSLKMSDNVGMKRKHMTRFLLVAFLGAVCFGWLVGLPIVYNYGAVSLHNFYTLTGSMAIERYINQEVANYQDVDVSRFLGIGAGILIVYVLMWLRTRFFWWPIHPIGFVLSQHEYIKYYWTGFFVAWVIKCLVTRWMGTEIAARIRPFFIGLVVGQAGVSALFAIIGLIVGG